MSKQISETMKALANPAASLIAHRWKRMLDVSTNHLQGKSHGSPRGSQPDCKTSEGGRESVRRSAKGGDS